MADLPVHPLPQNLDHALLEAAGRAQENAELMYSLVLTGAEPLDAGDDAVVGY